MKREIKKKEPHRVETSLSTFGALPPPPCGQNSLNSLLFLPAGFDQVGQLEISFRKQNELSRTAALFNEENPQSPLVLIPICYIWGIGLVFFLSPPPQEGTYHFYSQEEELSLSLPPTRVWVFDPQGNMIS